MSDKEKFHFEIPASNVHGESYEKRGFSPNVRRPDYQKHGKRLQSFANKVKKINEEKKDSSFTDNLYMKIETPKGVSLKSQKQKIENLGFDIFKLNQKKDSVGIARIGKKEFIEFEARLEEYINTFDNKGKTYFSPIEKLSEVPASEKINEFHVSSREKVDVMISLYNVLSTKEKLAINNLLINDLKLLNIEIKQRIFSNGLSAIECRLTLDEIQNIVNSYSTIKEIKPSSSFVIGQSILGDSLPTTLTIEKPTSNSTICIFDSGILSTNVLMSSIVKDRRQFLPSNAIAICGDHGTFVASRCVFGDEIDISISTLKLNPYCYILDVIVFGRDKIGNLIGLSDLDLMAAIEDVVEEFSSDIKVYNLSLGKPYPIYDDQFSDLAKLLDFLSKKHKVLFIIAAGNILQLLGSFPIDHYASSLSRIGAPAESLLGLTVGAIAKYENSTSLSKKNFISPFSRIGPGADKGIKPEVVAHGGNLIPPYLPNPRVSTYGVSKDGKNLATDVGTSFSAPLIAQYAQRLFDLYPNSDPNLVKALICHFCDERIKHDLLPDPLSNFVGFGEPNLDKAIRATNNSAAYIYEGKLDQNNYQNISFHIPSTLAAGMTDINLRVKITIGYDPPVNPDNMVEYSEARISAALFKLRDDELKKISITSEDKYNLPWNPIIKFEKSFSRSYSAGPWEVRLRLYTRGKVKPDYLQDYAIVIEIIDDGGTTDVHNSITEEFASIYKSIKIKVAA